jgi:RimJ/RimL family protein N-acetyltransferase
MITLQPFTQNDFSQLINWIPSEDVLINWSGSLFSFPLTTESLDWYIENTNVINQSDAFVYKVVDETNKPIGHISLGGLSWKNKSARISRVLIGDSNAKGKGYCHKMMHALLTIAFNDLKLHRVALGVYATNLVAINCYKKSGFTVEGINKDVLYYNNQYHTMYEMAILEDEWKALQ